MAPKGAKRQATTAPSGQACKKARHEAFLDDKVKVVVSALNQALDLPPDVRDLLKEGAKSSLTILSGQRHKINDTINSWVDEALQSVEAGLESKVAGAQKKIDGTEEEKASRERAQNSAEEVFAKLTEVSGDTMTTLDTNTLAHTNSKKALSDAKDAQKKNDANIVKISGLIEGLEATMERKYKALKEGSVKGKRAIDILMKSLLCVTVDGSLSQAVPTALQRKPSARSSFDAIVLTQFEDAVTQQFAEWRVKLDAAKWGKEQCGMSVVHAEAAAEKTFEQYTESHTLVSEARAALKEAQKSMIDFGADSWAAEIACQEAITALKDFQEGPFTLFRELRARTTASAIAAGSCEDEEVESPVCSCPLSACGLSQI